MTMRADEGQERWEKLIREALELGPHFQGCQAGPRNHWETRCTCGWDDWKREARALLAPTEAEAQGS